MSSAKHAGIGFATVSGAMSGNPSPISSLQIYRRPFARLMQLPGAESTRPILTLVGALFCKRGGLSLGEARMPELTCAAECRATGLSSLCTH